MNEKIFLDMLTTDSVSIRKQNYTSIDGVDYQMGGIWRKGYANNVQGRIDMQNEVAEPYRTAILAVWGNTPTVVPLQ